MINHTNKKNFLNRNINNFLMAVRFIIIITNTLLFSFALCADTSSEIVKYFLFQEPFETDKLFIYIFLFIMLVFFFISYIFIFIYVIVHHIYIKKHYQIPLSKFEVLGIIEFLIFSAFFIVVIFMGFTQWGWNPNDELIAYLIPMSDLFIVLPLLVLNIMAFAEYVWKLYFQKNFDLRLKKERQLRFLSIIFMVVSLTFILFLWGMPDTIVIYVGVLFQQVNKNSQIFKFINIYISLALLLIMFFFCLIYLIKRSIREQKKLIIMPDKHEVIIFVLFILIGSIFGLSTSTISMWANIEKESMEYLVIGIINSVLTVPTIFFFIIYYSQNLKKAIHHEI